MRATTLLLAAIGAAALCVAPATAQFPTTMNYQVMLTNDSDEPLVDEAVELVFNLYDMESGGVAEWTETHNTTTNGIGVVSVVLGSSNPLSVDDFPGVLWLEIEVDGDVLSPRRRLTSAPYSLAAYDARQLAGHTWDEFATHDELSTTGSINSPGNPVDWTKLKSVPAGFEDGTDDVGGAGDGHSLDAWDGAPVDAVWVAGQGYLGIGTTAPEGIVHAHVDTEYYTTLRLTNQMTGATGSDGLSLSMSPWDDASLRNQENGPLYLSAGGGSATSFRTDGSVWVARGSSVPVEFRVYGQPGGLDYLHRSFGDTHGGQFELHDDEGNIAVEFGADDAGTGGRIIVQRDDTHSVDRGIDLNGNWSSTGDPALRVLGSSRSALFSMNYEGNTSVTLPADAIFDYEILDEPGVTAVASNSSYGLTPGVDPMASSTITTPASGYVLAIGSCQLTVTHTNGTASDIDLGVSDSDTDFPANQEVNLLVPSSAATGSYAFPITVSGLFQVGSAGSYSYYFIGEEYSGSGIVYDVQFSLVYLPTAYGTVTPTLARGAAGARDETAVERGPVTPAEVVAQRAESEAANLARIERELAEIQAQVEAMKEER